MLHRDCIFPYHSLSFPRLPVHVRFLLTILPQNWRSEDAGFPPEPSRKKEQETVPLFYLFPVTNSPSEMCPKVCSRPYESTSCVQEVRKGTTGVIRRSKLEGKFSSAIRAAFSGQFCVPH
ncbi:hypothetical protein NDU88_003950 [Pleurodeles waltl]|uniref:Uncharacterized protein n=1 Tax=Pleurodeles waltl TaxID=8319 RepID=A0AAV7W6G3_PLEWA|nr:hypothetical protein NDU88_003950 [Pleurodeles waltl]